MQHQYGPISPAAREIRIASLEPGLFNDDIHITFGSYRLKEETRDDYEALSYCWGAPDNPSLVYILKDSKQQGSISITKNLEIALRHLRYTDRTRLIWADAICINQGDDYEKSWQVAIMGSIFERAACVVAWLGPEENSSSEAIRHLREASSHVQFDWRTGTLSPIDENRDPRWAHGDFFIPWSGEVLDIVCSLFQRPYFERLWVIPEIALAKRHVFHCGHATILGDEFWLAVAWNISKPTDPTRLSRSRINEYFKAKFAVINASPEYNRPRSFEYSRLLTKARGRRSYCKDPRDKIYGITSLLITKDYNLNIMPDYTKRVEDLYAEVASCVITRRRTMKVLESCELSSKALKIPSWVPDWSSFLKIRDPVFSTWSACGYISSQSLVKDNGQTCQAPGIRAGLVESSIESQFTEEACYADEFLSLVRSLKPSNADDLNSCYKAGGTCLEAYCYVLNCGKFADSHNYASGSAPQSMQQRSMDLNLFWSTNKPFDELGDADSFQFLNTAHHYLIGRCLIKTSNGYLGLAPTGTKKGDVVCVVLGCRFPIVLRPVESNRGWLVIGPCYVHGLMNGELIYRGNLPKHYRSIWLKDPGRSEEEPDGEPFAMYDSLQQTYISDPVKLLEESGIKVEKFNKDPYILEVLPETLKAAGLALENFILI